MQLVTQGDFYRALRLGYCGPAFVNDPPLLFSADKGSPVFRKLPDFLLHVAKDPVFSGHRLELIRRENGHEVNARPIAASDRKIYGVRAQMSCWDSAWLRMIDNQQRGRLMPALNSNIIDDFIRLTGWTVLGFRWSSQGALDFLTIFAVPRRKLPDLSPQEFDRAIIGRPRILSGLLFQFSLKPAMTSFCPTALAVIRLRLSRFHRGLPVQLLIWARACLVAAKAKLMTKHWEHRILANWVEAAFSAQPIQRPLRVPLSLLANLVVDKWFARQREALWSETQFTAYNATVRGIRESYGCLLLDETPPKDRFAIRAFSLP
jgi:hypothetical protein